MLDSWARGRVTSIADPKPHSAPDDSWTPDESVSSEKEREEGRNGTAGPRGVQHRTIGPGLTWRPQKVQRRANGRPRCPHDPDEAFDATPPHQPVRGAPCTPKTSGRIKEQKNKLVRGRRAALPPATPRPMHPSLRHTSEGGSVVEEAPLKQRHGHTVQLS